MNNNSRRKFLKNVTGLLATGLVTGTSMGNTLKDMNTPERKEEIIYRTLGRTGIKVPIVSMGVMNSSNPNLVKIAWQSGIRHFDTAWGYQGGNNERMIGKVIKELKIDRKDIIITTKTPLDAHLEKPGQGEGRKKQFLSRFNQSLERLQTDYIDILMYHSVNNTTEATDPYVKEAMQELKDKGKIRFKAFSTHVHWPEILKVAANEGFYDVVLLSFNYSMNNDKTAFEVIKYAVSKGIGLIAMKTQCQQDWYKSNLSAEMQKFYEGNIMHGALLKWALRHDFIATSIPGFTTFEQLKTVMEVAYNIDYTTDERKFLEDHHVVDAIQSVCRFCGGCNDTCPHGVDIPALMRTQMYASSYGNLHMARSTFSGIAQENGLEVCEECDECVAQCRNNVPIAQRLDELKMLMA